MSTPKSMVLLAAETIWEKCKAAFALRSHTHNYAGSASAGGAATMATTANGIVSYDAAGARADRVGQYTKIATVTMTQAWEGGSLLLAVVERGAYKGAGLLQLRFRVNGTNTGSDRREIKWVWVMGEMQNKTGDFMLVYAASTYELWMRFSETWDAFRVIPIASTGKAVTLLTDQPCQTNAPEGNALAATVLKLTNDTSGNAASANQLLNFYSNRPASANLTADGSGGLRVFKASGAMTLGKPATNGHILHMSWDDATGYDVQLAIGNSAAQMEYRAQTAGTWGAWKRVLDTENWGSYIQPFIGVSENHQTGTAGLVPAPPDYYPTLETTLPMYLGADGQWQHMSLADTESAGLMSASDKEKLDALEPAGVTAQWTLLWSGTWGADGSSEITVPNLWNYSTIAIRDSNNTICMANVAFALDDVTTTFSTFFPQTLENGGLSIRRHRIDATKHVGVVTLDVVTARATMMTDAGVWTNSVYTQNSIVAIYGVK